MMHQMSIDQEDSVMTIILLMKKVLPTRKSIYQHTINNVICKFFYLTSCSCCTPYSRYTELEGDLSLTRILVLNTFTSYTEKNPLALRIFRYALTPRYQHN